MLHYNIDIGNLSHLKEILLFYGSFTLTEMDLDTDSDSDLKPNGYIVLYRTCLHCTDSDSDPYSLFRVG